MNIGIRVLILFRALLRRVKYNEEIANEPDSLKKLKLIEKYSKELYEASRCLMLLELVEMINKGGIF